MSSKNRVFSNDHDVDYHEYLQNKNGIEIIKNIKSKNKNLSMHYFINYQQFITLTKAYYKFIDLEKCNSYALASLFQSNTSFITYQQWINHINKCNHCHYQKNDIFNIYNNDHCKELKQILYPYGEYISNYISNIYFPSNLDLNKWCLKKKDCCREIVTHHRCDYKNFIINNKNNYHDIDDNKNDRVNNSTSIYHNSNKKQCGKYGLCKNAKPLFINDQ